MSRSLDKSGLPPIAFPDARALILGTLPGDQSLRRQEYYAHPQNQFWRILAAGFGETITAATYEQKIALVRRHRLAVWDVLQTAERSGSLDSAIRNQRSNDFVPFLARHPEISAIAFNGQRAHALFQKCVAPHLVALGRPFTTAVLPSTSPAYTLPFAAKAAQWQAFIHCIRETA